MQLNETQLIELRNIANAVRGRTATLARNILCFGYQECENGYPEPPAFRKKSTRIYDFNNTLVIESEREINGLETYPNPFHEALNIILTNHNKDASYNYQIIDFNGRLLIQGSLINPRNTLDLSQLANGSYFIIINVNGENRYRKLIVKQ